MALVEDEGMSAVDLATAFQAHGLELVCRNNDILERRWQPHWGSPLSAPFKNTLLDFTSRDDVPHFVFQVPQELFRLDVLAPLTHGHVRDDMTRVAEPCRL